MVIVLFDFFVNQIAVGVEVDLCFKSVIELFELFADGFLMLFWSVVGYKLLCREKSQVVYKELCCGKGIVSVCYNRELLVDYSVFKEEVCIAFNDVVKILFVLGDYAFNLF